MAANDDGTRLWRRRPGRSGPAAERSMDVCLLSCARNAGRHLREWFQYHRASGITAFYIVDHQPSEDDTSEIIREHADVVLTKTGPFKESDWFLELCDLATTDGAAVIYANDTDEFLCGNGAPLAQRIRETLAGAHQLRHKPRDAAGKPTGPPALHLMTPGFNMVPLGRDGEDPGEDGAGDWRRHVLARPNKLWTGKSALYIPQGGHVRVVSGGQHYLQTLPRVPICTCPKRTRTDIVSPLEPQLFPVYYLHFTFHGPSAYLRRIRTMLQTPENARQMVQRYAKGVVPEERLLKPTPEDVERFLAFVDSGTPEALELYRQAVRSSLISANEVRTAVADFFGLSGVPKTWTADAHKKALRYWGLEESRLEGELTFPAKTRAEDLY